MILNTSCFQIALSIDEFCLQERVIQAAADDDTESGGDVGAEIQEDGNKSGDTLTAKVSKLNLWLEGVRLLDCSLL